MAHFSQYKLNTLLIKQLESIGFKIRGHEALNYNHLPEKEILMGHNCISVEPTEEFINVTTSYVTEGKHVENQIPCRFLVGADGAGSTVRNLVGIEMRGEKDIQRLVSVHFLSQELGKYLIYEKPGMLFFIFNPGAIGVLVAHDLKQGEFVLQVLEICLFLVFISIFYSLLCCCLKLGICFYDNLLQMPFYPPQQKFEDFTSEVILFAVNLIF